MNQALLTQAQKLMDSHKNKLITKYGINCDCPQIKHLIESGLLRSVTAEEARQLLHRDDIESTGILLKYPGRPEVFTIRFDQPPQTKNGKQQKYLRPPGQGNALFIPPGVELSGPEIWITEGEFKALAAAIRGLPVVAISGIWNWRSSQTKSELFSLTGEKLPDEEALIGELNRNWQGTSFVLIYDSDIDRNHPGWPAYGRLAEQLYRLGAEEVRILTLPPVAENGKTGLDDFLLTREKNGADVVAELKALIAAKPVWVPTSAGAAAFAAKRLPSPNLDDRVTAAAALLAAKGETGLTTALREAGIKGELAKAIKKDAKAKLNEIIDHQSPAKEIEKAPESLAGGAGTVLAEAYQPYIEALREAAKYRPNEGYTLDHNGVLYWCRIKKLPNGETYHDGGRLANFVARVLRQIIKDNGADVERFFEIEGLLAGGRPLPAACVPVKAIANMTWPIEIWGLEPAIEPGTLNKDRMRHCLQLVSGAAETVTIYCHLGWRQINGRWVYLHAGGAIGDETIKVDFDEGAQSLQAYELPSVVENPAEAVRQSLQLLDVVDRRVSLVLWSLVYTAPLLELFRRAGIVIGFSTILQGATGSLKSTLAALFLNHFGYFHHRSLPASFEDTENILEKKAFLTKDSLLVIDDLYPSKSRDEKRRKEQVMQKIIRRVGNRSSRGRLKADTSFRPSYPPRGLVLMTVEILTSGQSSLARTLELQVDREMVDLNKLTDAQKENNLAKLRQAMRAYIEWVSENFDSLTNEIKNSFSRLRYQFLQGNIHLQQPEIAAALSLGLTVGLNHAVARKAISKEEAVALLREGYEVFKYWLAQQACKIQDERPTKLFLDILKELFAQQKVYVKGLDQDEIPPAPEKLGWNMELLEDTEHWQPAVGADFIGWADELFLYLLPNIVYEKVCRVIHGQGDAFPVNAPTLWKMLDEEKMLIPETGKERVYRVSQKKINGVKYRVVKLKNYIVCSDESL